MSSSSPTHPATPATPATPAAPAKPAPLVESRLALWAAFVLVHLAVSLPTMFAPHTPLADVTRVYLGWMQQALSGGPLVGVDQAWVYPIAALVPMWIPLLGGTTVFGYGFAWIVLVTVVDAVAFAVLLRRTSTPKAATSRARAVAAWWWLAYMLLLGVIGVARLDGLTAPLALIAMLVAVNRPVIASVLLSVATWIKIWPAAVLAAGVIVLRGRWRIVVAAIVTSVVIVGAALVAGSGLTVFSFITEQTGRGIQIESPIALPYLWAAAFHVPGFGTYYDTGILTFQVTGFGVRTVSAAMNPLMVIALAVAAWFGWRAVRAGAPVVRLFPQLALALVLVFIVFNKVGSPQYMSWLIAPMAALIVVGARRLPLLAGLALVLAFLTQIIYPYFYDNLIATDAWMVLLISVRNLGLIVMLVVVAQGMWVEGSRARTLRTDVTTS